MWHLCRTPGVPLSDTFISSSYHSLDCTCCLECPFRHFPFPKFYSAFSAQLKYFLLHEALSSLALLKLKLCLLRLLLAMVLKLGSHWKCLRTPEPDPLKWSLWAVHIIRITLNSYCVASSASGPRTRWENMSDCISSANLFWSYVPYHFHSSRCRIFPKSLWTPSRQVEKPTFGESPWAQALCSILTHTQ